MSQQCKDCRNRMTWAAVRVQFGRLIRQGIDPEAVKTILPRCQKCIARWLKES